MILEALGSAIVPRSKYRLVTMKDSLGFLPLLRSSRGFPPTGLEYNGARLEAKQVVAIE